MSEQDKLYQLLRDSESGPDYPLPGPSACTAKAWAAYRAEMYGVPARASDCPECGGWGWLRDDVQAAHDGFGALVPCPTCSGGTRLEWITCNCGLERGELDARLCDWRLGNWDERALREQRQAVRVAIERALAQRCGFFTFWGDFGAGKSHALKVVVNELRLEGVEVFYAPFAQVLDHLRSLFRQKRESSHFWERLLDIPALALDEVTRFHETPWAQERLWVLADTRYRRFGSHLTLFATNDDPTVPLPTSEAVGYLYSRMRQGELVELRGDMRPAVRHQG